MADIRYDFIDKEHKMSSYDNILNAYNWICDSINFVCKDIEIKEIDCIIDFVSGNMSYSCKNIDEFKKYAFGKTFKLRDICVFAMSESTRSILSIFTRYTTSEEQIYTIVSEDEKLIADMVAALANESKPQENNPTSITVNFEDNSVHVGDGNTISNSVFGQNNSILGNDKHPKKKNSFLKIFWDILIPIIVGIVVTAICVWLGIQK